MRPLRNLASELVERRLWPVALLLVVALVAVPLLLAKPSSPADEAAAPASAPAPVAPPVASAAATPPPGGGPVVSVAQADVPDAPLRGREKNPFRQQHLAAQPPTTVTSSATTSSSTPAPAPTTGAGGGSGGSGGGTGGGSQPPASPTPTYTYASIDVRFGHAGRHLRRIDDVPRLTPLPSALHPVVVFLGMRRDRATAVFLVSTDVHVQGLGQCVPSRKDCEAIQLRAGDTAFLDFAQHDGSVVQYELDLVRVTLHQTSSQALAQRAYARVSRAGRLLLAGDSVHSSADGVMQPRRLPFRYVLRNGVLHIAPWASRSARARAHGAISGGQLADLPQSGQ
ncbi:MAG: hypothetical protein JSS99_14495 [Actinobacteria bacterium]|nr:hypothetical protein [Actinomycetota bacterium]